MFRIYDKYARCLLDLISLTQKNSRSLKEQLFYGYY